MLIPMAALDDLVGALVFFTVVALVSAHVSTAGIPVLGVLFLVFLPVLIGAATGFVAGKLLQKAHTAKRSACRNAVAAAVFGGNRHGAESICSALYRPSIFCLLVWRFRRCLQI